MLLHPRVPTENGQPIAQSGITIGIGYDLGQNSADEIRRDWSAYLPAETVDRLVVAANRRRDAALALQPSLRDITIPYNLALQVYYNRSLPDFVTQTESIYPGAANQINPTALAALASMVFNRGASLTGPSRLEMRQIRDAIAGNHLELIPDLLRAMRTRTPVRSRRMREAAFFETWYTSSTDPCQ